MKYFSIIIVLVAFIGGLLANQRRKKKGEHDEVYERNTQKAKAFSWYATLATIIMFLWMFTFLELTISAHVVVLILFSVHVVTWGISVMVLMLYTYS